MSLRAQGLSAKRCVSTLAKLADASLSFRCIRSKLGSGRSLSLGHTAPAKSIYIVAQCDQLLHRYTGCTLKRTIRAC